MLDFFAATLSVFLPLFLPLLVVVVELVAFVDRNLLLLLLQESRSGWPLFLHLSFRFSDRRFEDLRFEEQ